MLRGHQRPNQTLRGPSLKNNPDPTPLTITN
jgi:hypothetical protein